MKKLCYTLIGDIMIKYIDETILKTVLDSNDKLILVFAKGINCGVCHAVEARINQTYPSKHNKLDIYYLTVEENPKFRGEHLIFTFPTILLFDGKKEIHRESRIIDFNKLDRIISNYY
ncbi:MAG TPA: thioredoxin family protein [Acholeplasmataceae bacterium]|nr:thioredoxin family protein [Acholeplasmataceae bacterium]